MVDYPQDKFLGVVMTFSNRLARTNIWPMKDLADTDRL